MLPDRPPNWKKWRHMPDVKIWEAVALSLDIDPDEVFHNSQGWMVDTHLFDESKEFGDRLQIAGRCLGAGTGLSPRILSMSDRSASRVSLAEFAAWAISVDFQIPTQLVDMATLKAKNTTPEKKSAWPWGDHETELLRKLSAAAKRYWVNYDPSEPDTAPTNRDVTDWLKSQGVADRTAEVMATILRVDGLRPGPRK
jgi:hypothetical protein